MLQDPHSSLRPLNETSQKHNSNQTKKNGVDKNSNVTVTSTTLSDTPLLTLNSFSNEKTLNSQTEHPAHMSSDQAALSMVSMPVGVPLSGLTTLPIALCSMNGCSNIGLNNAVQQNAGIMTQSGIVLLNMAGNNPTLSGLPQIMTCNQAAQSLQPMMAANNIVNQTASSSSQLQIQSLPIQPQMHANVAGASQVLNQMSMQSAVLPQGAPTAFMLVPIHQVASNQSVLQQQNLVTVTSSSTDQPITVQVGGNNQNILTNHMPDAGLSTSGTFQTNFEPAPNLNLPTSSVLSSSREMFENPAILASSTSSPILVTSTSPNPINDPHISSSVQATSVPNTPVLAVPPQNSDAHHDTSVDNLVAVHLTDQPNEAIQVESLIPTATSGDAVIPSEATISSSSSTQACTKEGPTKTAEKRKKGPAPKLDGNELCRVCSDKASGYHYGVLSCEGCKGFFRRCIIKSVGYQCKAQGQCQMDTYMRRKCQACRLKKCRAVGMMDDNVFSEVHSGSRAKKSKREVVDCNQTDYLHTDSMLASGGTPTLTSNQMNVVKMLQENENRYQWPVQEDVDKVTPWMEHGDCQLNRAARFAHFTELSILIVQLVVEFTKQLPGFLSVSREDQIVLLKACTIEVMLLRAAKQYDKTTKSINFLNGKYYNKSSFYRAGMQVEFVDPIFDFCKSMAKLGLDEAEYALLVAINTFSTDRQNLKDLGKIETVQDSYVELLRVYLRIHHPSDPLMFPRTLMKLVELRTLNNYHSEQMFALKVQDKQLPPLLAEIWDM